MFLDTGLGTIAIISMPFIPFYLRKIAPSLEAITGYLEKIVASIDEGKLDEKK